MAPSKSLSRRSIRVHLRARRRGDDDHCEAKNDRNGQARGRYIRRNLLRLPICNRQQIPVSLGNYLEQVSLSWNCPLYRSWPADDGLRELTEHGRNRAQWCASDACHPWRRPFRRLRSRARWKARPAAASSEGEPAYFAVISIEFWSSSGSSCPASTQRYFVFDSAGWYSKYRFAWPLPYSPQPKSRGSFLSCRSIIRA